VLSGASKGGRSQNTRRPRGKSYVDFFYSSSRQKYIYRYRYDGLYVVKKVRRSLDIGVSHLTRSFNAGVDRKRA